VVKNKCAPPFTEAEFDIRWGTGIDTCADLVEIAAQVGVLEKNGSHYLFGGKSVGQGRDKTRDAILTDPALFQAVRKRTLEALPSRAPKLDRTDKTAATDKLDKTPKPEKKTAA
jgi:recombination protein RecA